MKKVLVMLSTLLMVFVTVTSAIADVYACKEECMKCSAVCKKALKHCSEMGGEHAQADHIKTMQECIEACDHVAASIGNKDSTEQDMCKTCTDACIKCAALCDSMKDDKIMQRCASECRMCVKALKARWGYNDAIQGTSER